jgi:hypothetical protein
MENCDEPPTAPCFYEMIGREDAGIFHADGVGLGRREQQQTQRSALRDRAV